METDGYLYPTSCAKKTSTEMNQQGKPVSYLMAAVLASLVHSPNTSDDQENIWLPGMIKDPHSWPWTSRKIEAMQILL
jgi:hypothetical protein